MADLAKHACEDRALRVLGRAPDLAEAERTQGAPVPLALADLGSDLGDLHFRHLAVLLLPGKTALGLLCLRSSLRLLHWGLLGRRLRLESRNLGLGCSCRRGGLLHWGFVRNGLRLQDRCLRL